MLSTLWLLKSPTKETKMTSTFYCSVVRLHNRKKSNPAEVNGREQRTRYGIRKYGIPGSGAGGPGGQTAFPRLGRNAAPPPPPPRPRPLRPGGWTRRPPDFPAAPCGPGMPSVGAAAPALGAPGRERVAGRGEVRRDVEEPSGSAVDQGPGRSRGRGGEAAG